MQYRIMVVDDEKLLGESLCELLNYHGYETLYASNGQDAVEMIRQKRPDVILTDLIMPQMDGLELIEYVKEHFPDIGMIMITAYGTVESSVKALKKGAFDYITKPFREEEITQCLIRYFEQVRLKKENISLRQLNELKDKFLSLASHELNTPLMIISGYLDILKQDPDMQPQHRHYIEGAYNACQRLANIITGLRYLTYSPSDLHLETLHLNPWLKQVAAPYIPIVQRRKQKLTIEIPEQPIHVEADHDTLQQVINNLVSNSIKFTPDGGIIHLGMIADKEEVKIFCKDTGDGIPGESLEHIFESFYTGTPLLYHHTAVNYEYQGGGIGNGLAIAKHLCEIQKATISVISRQKEGSYFWVTFRRVEK